MGKVFNFETQQGQFFSVEDVWGEYSSAVRQAAIKAIELNPNEDEVRFRTTDEEHKLAQHAVIVAVFVDGDTPFIHLYDVFGNCFDRTKRPLSGYVGN